MANSWQVHPSASNGKERKAWSINHKVSAHEKSKLIYDTIVLVLLLLLLLYEKYLRTYGCSPTLNPHPVCIFVFNKPIVPDTTLTRYQTMPTTSSVAMNHPSWRSTAAVLQQATHLVSPKQLVIGDIFHPVVRVQELHHSVMPHVLAILAGVVPAVRFAHRQKAH